MDLNPSSTATLAVITRGAAVDRAGEGTQPPEGQQVLAAALNRKDGS